MLDRCAFVELADALATIEIQQGQIEALEDQVRDRDERIRELELERQRNAFEIARLRRALFGDKSERLTATHQLSLPGLALDFTPRLATEAQACTVRVEAHERKRTRSRASLELDPSRVDEHIEEHYPDQRTCSCCGEALRVNGQETKTVIERLPVRFKRTTHIRYKMACSNCKQAGVLIAPPIDSVVPGCGPVGVTLAVHIATQHFADHLPYHRIALILQREGLRIDRSTLARVGFRVAKQLAKLVSVMENEILASDAVVGVDGTGIKILAKEHCARRSVYVMHAQGHVVFRALKSQSADTVLKGFSSYRGVLLTDAAKVFTGNYRAAHGIQLALCNAHARRYFYDAQATDRARCEYALSVYRTVAVFEQQIASLDAKQRTQERQRVLVPLFESYRVWLTEQCGLVPPRSPIQEALAYALTHWNGLTMFLQDGRIPWTNNESERLLQHIVVGRKSWVFRGSFEGAQLGCVLWSLTMSCRLYQIDPVKYLTDTLHAMSEVSASQLSLWTPKAYAQRARANS